MVSNFFLVLVCSLYIFLNRLFFIYLVQSHGSLSFSFEVFDKMNLLVINITCIVCKICSGQPMSPNWSSTWASMASIRKTSSSEKAASTRSESCSLKRNRFSILLPLTNEFRTSAGKNQFLFLLEWLLDGNCISTWCSSCLFPCLLVIFLFDF